MWMVMPDAERCALTQTPTVDGQALLQLVELFELHCGKLLDKESDPQKESSHEATLVDRASTPK